MEMQQLTDNMTFDKNHGDNNYNYDLKYDWCDDSWIYTYIKWIDLQYSDLGWQFLYRSN